MAISLDKIKNASDARSLLLKRRDPGAEANTKFYGGDHWQNSNGWIGARPLTGAAGAAQTMLQIKEGFVSENVIAEVDDRHLAGILGREPLWGFIPKETVSPSTTRRRNRLAKLFSLVLGQSSTPTEMNKFAQEADEALTVWWDQGEARSSLKQAVTTVLNEEKVLLRLFVPKGLVDETGSVAQQSSLTDALRYLNVDVVTADKGGVFADSLTQKQFAVFIYTDEEKNEFAELSFVDEQGQTVSQVLGKDGEISRTSYDLQGRLLMYEFSRKPLITEQVRSLQRAINLSLTMMVRNVNMAGSLERTVMNAERPMEKVRIADATQPLNYREENRPIDFKVGAGATNFLTGLLIRDDDGNIIGRANPNISFREPVSIESFTGTRDQLYASILGQTQQRHALISGDAVASGTSRNQARAEFRGSLMLTKEGTDSTGRWLMEVTLLFAAQLCNRTKDFVGLRNEFNSLIEDGPVEAEERSANREDVAAGLMSKETAMSRNGADDTDAELARIAEEKAATPAPVDPPTGDRQ